MRQIKYWGLAAVLTLVFILSLSVAFAAIVITEQPSTQTVKAGGTITFSCKATGAGDQPISWYFTNPKTNETYTGKKLPSAVPGVKVTRPNSMNITLKNVPSDLHGWTVYCHIGMKDSGVDTDQAMILIDGMPNPEKAGITDDSPAGIWVLACHNDKSETFYVYDFNSNGTATLYEMLPSWSMTGVVKIKWSLSGETIKYTITEKDKGYSASVPVTLNFDMTLSFKDGIVYLGKNAMTKIEFHNYSR